MEYRIKSKEIAVFTRDLKDMQYDEKFQFYTQFDLY